MVLLYVLCLRSYVYINILNKMVIADDVLFEFVGLGAEVHHACLLLLLAQLELTLLLWIGGRRVLGSLFEGSFEDLVHFADVE